MRPLLNFLRGEEAVTAVEYAVMLALILIAIISSIAQVGGGTGDLYRSNLDALQSHLPS
jgi:Flp pilus assembly pilin Flp